MIKDFLKASSLGSRLAFVALKYGIASAPGAGLNILLHEGPRDLPVKMAGDLLVRVLSSGGPVYVKLGQILSTRRDLLPPKVCGRLEKLLDGQDPLPFGIIKSTVRKYLKLEKQEWPFKSFEKRAIGAGSVGQVHFAELKNGTRVAVKVLKPGVAKRVKRDLAELEAICRLVLEYYPMSDEGRKSLSFLFDSFVQDLSQSLQEECDFTFEKSNLKEFHNRFKKNPDIVVPKVFDEYCSPFLLVMERIEGVPLHEFQKNQSSSARAALAEKYFQEILRQIFEEGHFHADPHSGNVLVLDDGRLALIDLGLTGSLGPKERGVLSRSVKAFVSRDPDALIESLLEFGVCGPKFDYDTFKAEILAAVTAHKATAVNDLGKFVQEMFRVAYVHEIYVPRESALLVKTLVTLEGVTRSLNPEADLAKLATPVVLKALARRWFKWPFRS